MDEKKLLTAVVFYHYRITGTEFTTLLFRNIFRKEFLSKLNFKKTLETLNLF